MTQIESPNFNFDEKLDYKDRLFMLKYVYGHPWGYMRELEKLNKPDVLKAMLTTGLLKSGYTRTAKTYAITDLGTRYCLVVLTDMELLGCKIVRFLTGRSPKTR